MASLSPTQRIEDPRLLRGLGSFVDDIDPPGVLHAAVLRLAQPRRVEVDVFPKVYRLNTRGALQRHFPPDSWWLRVVGHTPEPAYAGRSPALRLAFGALHRVLPDALAVSLFAFARRL